MGLSFKSIFYLVLFLILSCATVDKKNQYRGELKRHINVRFAFSVLVPKDFRQKFSTNGDGIILISSKDENVEIRASGGYNALFHTFEEEVLYRLEGEKLLSRVEFDVRNKKTNHLIKGIKLISEDDEQRLFQAIFFYNKIVYSIWCRAPKKEFKFYQKLFENVAESIHFLEPSA